MHIPSVQFGNPTGYCTDGPGKMQQNPICNAPSTQVEVERKCLQKNNCSAEQFRSTQAEHVWQVGEEHGGCPGTGQWFFVELACAAPGTPVGDPPLARCAPSVTAVAKWHDWAVCEPKRRLRICWTQSLTPTYAQPPAPRDHARATISVWMKFCHHRSARQTAARMGGMHTLCPCLFPDCRT